MAGHSGVELVARTSGISRKTVSAGVAELEAGGGAAGGADPQARRRAQAADPDRSCPGWGAGCAGGADLAGHRAGALGLYRDKPGSQSGR
jgi:hypothetical protein